MLQYDNYAFSKFDVVPKVHSLFGSGMMESDSGTCSIVGNLHREARPWIIMQTIDHKNDRFWDA